MANGAMVSESSTSRREKILEAIREADAALRPKEIAEATDLTPNNVRGAVREMLGAGLLVQPEYGKYDLPENVPPEKRYNPQSEEESAEPHGEADAQYIQTSVIVASAGDGAAPERTSSHTVPAAQYRRDFHKTPPTNGHAPSDWYVKVEGDSMAPEFFEGDYLPIELFEGTLQDVRHNGLYVVYLHDTIQIKRVAVEANRIRLRCTNPNYEDVTIELNEASDFRVLARVRLNQRDALIGAFMRRIVGK